MDGKNWYKVSDILKAVGEGERSVLAKNIKEYPNNIRFLYTIDPKTSRKSHNPSRFIEQNIFLWILAKSNSVHAKNLVQEIFEKVEILE